MDQIQVAKLNMYRSVEQLCNDNNALISGNPAFLSAFNDFSGKIAGLLSTAAAEKEVITGITIDKSLAKKDLCQNAYDIASIVFAYASATGNNVLKHTVKFSFSDLTRLKDNMLVPVCENIYNSTNDNAAGLVSYGITPDMLAALNTSMESYTAAVPKPKTAKSVKSAFVSNLKLLVKEADIIVKDRMDKMMSTFKATDPGFVESYKNARVIIDPAHTKRKSPATAAAA